MSTHHHKNHIERLSSLLWKKANNGQLFVHGLFLIAILALAAWVLAGIAPQLFGFFSAQDDAGMSEHMMMDGNMDMVHEEGTARQSGMVHSNDDAVRAYLQAAQILAEVYKHTNGGSYSGLCEASQDQYTLEGESGGILKYIKMVGATEVYCYTADGGYMIEAKQPESGLFFCIDDSGAAIEQEETREDLHRCT